MLKRDANPTNSNGQIKARRSRPWLQAWTPAGFQWNSVELPVKRLPRELNGLRVVHLTDLHFRPRWSTAYDRIIQRVNEVPPDLLVITGDFVENKYNPRKELPYVERFITALTSRLGTYAILGNHDGHLLGAHLARWNVRLIENRMVRVTRTSASIELIGLEGVVRQDLRVEKLERIPPKDPGALRIVLSHYPDAIVRGRDLNADLFLAGHTHGGQICLPGGVPILTHDSLPRAYSKGIHRVQDTWLVSNRGLGFTTIPLRVFCPAEVVEITVLSAES